MLLILLAQRHDDGALAAPLATVPVGTILGLIAFAGADPGSAQTAVAGLLAWLGAALLYLQLTR